MKTESDLSLGHGSPGAGWMLRASMLLYLWSSLFWLIAGGALQLVHSIQLHTPEFFAHWESMTFGRTQAAAESALVYGWIANAGFLAQWWILGRLGGGRFGGAAAALFAGFFWNLGVTLGIAGILHGELGVFPLFHMPATVVPLLGVSYAAFSLAGLMAWTGRDRAASHAAQWYAVASLYAFPWICSAAYVMLRFHVVPGVSQAVLAAWAGEALRMLWIAPVALSASYYLAPKITGRTVEGYHFAAVGFWVLVLFAPWAGTRQLAGSPVPVWLPTVGISFGFLLLVHFGIVASNMRDAFSHAGQSTALRFVLLGVASYLVLGVMDTVLSLRTVSAHLQFTHLTEARFGLLVFGVFTPSVFGAFYFLLPRVTGRAWASDGLIASHYTCTWVGVLLMVVGYVVAGLEQGFGLSDPQNSFEAVAASVRPWLLAASHGVGVVLLGAVLVLVNLIFHTLPRSASVGAAKTSGGHA